MKNIYQAVAAFQQEEWRSVIGYEGLYEVSSQGNVRSLDRVVSHKRYGKQNKKGRILVLNPNSNGYIKAKLTKNGVTRAYAVHRIVADAFIDNVGAKRFVNHINFDRSDNRVSNLEWVTARENCNHSLASKETSSKYAGVSWNKNAGKWIANIRMGDEQIYLGLFEDELSASLKYREYEKSL